MNPKPKILFTEEALPFILEAFGKSIDGNGIIIDNATGDPINTPEGLELTKDQLGAIKKGSELFLKDDILSIINIVEETY